MSDALVTQLARALNLPPDAARHTLDRLVAALRDQLDATGQAEVPGLGTFHRDDDGLAFRPDDALARAVNHRYVGLRPIHAGPAVKEEPEEEPQDADETDVEDGEDPFAAASPEAPASSHETDPDETGAPEETETPDEEPDESPVGFQPLQSFIEPDDEQEDDSAQDDDFAPKPADAFEHARPDAPDAEPPSESPFADEEENIEAEQHVDDLLAGTWTTASEKPDDEHVLGPMPPDDIEEADYDLVEPDEAVQEPIDEDITDAEFEETEEPFVDEADTAPEEAEDEDEIEANDTTVVPPIPAEPPPVAASETSEPESPELEAEPPADIPTVAPAVAATARPPAGREPAEPAKRSHTPIVLTVIAVVLGGLALVWLLNREPDGPVVADQRPVATDTTTTASPPPADTLADAVPADTATVAEAPPEPDAPPASTDPLRSTAGLDPDAGGFTWVVASELDRAAAERQVARYREQGLRTGVVAEEAGGRTRYRVSLGQFDSIAAAEARRADLPADVPSDSWILQL